MRAPSSIHPPLKVLSFVLSLRRVRQRHCSCLPLASRLLLWPCLLRCVLRKAAELALLPAQPPPSASRPSAEEVGLQPNGDDERSWLRGGAVVCEAVVDAAAAFAAEARVHARQPAHVTACLAEHLASSPRGRRPSSASARRCAAADAAAALQCRRPMWKAEEVRCRG